MGKYYVRSGNIQGIAGAPSRNEAAYRVLRRQLQRWRDSLELGETVVTSERGFDGPCDAETLDTQSFLAETGLAAEFGLSLQIPAACPPHGDALWCGCGVKVFPLDRFEMDSNGRKLELRTWGASGHGKTVHVWQLEGQPLCIDIYRFETEEYAEVVGKSPDVEIERDHSMPDEDVLHALVLGLLEP